MTKIRRYYQSDIGMTADQIADFWCDISPYHGVNPKDYEKIKAATVMYPRGVARPTFQTMCCFLHDTPAVERRAALSKAIQALVVDKTCSFGNIAGFSAYFQRIVSRRMCFLYSESVEGGSPLVVASGE